MKTVLSLVLASVFCSAIFIPQRAMSQGHNSIGDIHRHAGAIQNRYIVVLNNRIDRARVTALANELAQSNGGTLLYTYEHAIKGFAVEMSEAAALAVSHNPSVS